MIATSKLGEKVVAVATGNGGHLPPRPLGDLETGDNPVTTGPGMLPAQSVTIHRGCSLRPTGCERQRLLRVHSFASGHPRAAQSFCPS